MQSDGFRTENGTKRCISGKRIKNTTIPLIGLMVLLSWSGLTLAQNTAELDLQTHEKLYIEDSHRSGSDSRSTSERERPELNFVSEERALLTVSEERDAVVCTRESCVCLSLGEDGQPGVSTIQRHEAFQFIQEGRTRCSS